MLGPAGLDLLCRMIRYQPELRITANDALMHPYFNDHKARMQQAAHFSSIN